MPLTSENGIYLCLIMCLICLRIVTKNSAQKYTSRIGQKTGTSNSGNSVATSEAATERALAHQNLNSGSLRWKGRNSSERWEGRVGPSSSGSICFFVGGGGGGGEGGPGE